MKKKISLFLSIIMILNILSNINIGKMDFGVVKAKASTSSNLDRSYTELTEEEKDNIKLDFGVSESELIKGRELGLNIDETLEMNGLMESFGYPTDTAKLIVKSSVLEKTRIIIDSNRMLDYIGNS